MDSINDIKKYGSLFTHKGVPTYSNVSSVRHTTRDATKNTANYQNSSKQHLRGEITDLKNNEITIRLDDNSVVKAKIFDSSNLNIGQQVTFKLQETINGLVVEAIKSNLSDSDSIISKALEAADLVANEKNISVVKTLLENNMSIDKQTIYKILQESYTHKSVSIKSLVLMEKNNIPFTTDNITGFENYCNYEHRIIKELDTISASIPDMMDIIAKDSSINELVDYNHKLIDIICNNDTESITKNFNEIPVSSAYFSPEDPDELVQVLSNYDVAQEELDEIVFGSASLKDVSDLILACLEKADEIDDYHVSSINAKNANAFSKLTLAKDAFENPVIKTILDKYADIQRDNSELASFMNNYNRAQLISKLRDIDNTWELSTKIWKGSIVSSDLLKELDELFIQICNTNNIDKEASTLHPNIDTSLKELGELDELLHSDIMKSESYELYNLTNDNEQNLLTFNTVRRLITSAQYKTIIKETIINNWTLSPNQLKEAHSIEDTYNKIYKQLNRIENFVKETIASETKDKLALNIKNTKSNIDFMSTLNELFSYVQIPLKMRNQNVHSDLYVLTNKKNLKTNKSNINVLLHLDMQYLGSLDINLLLNNNVITGKFNVSDQTTKALLETNMENLEFALMEKGFLLKTNVEINNNSVDLVKDFIEKDSPTTSLKRYTFDIRT